MAILLYWGFLEKFKQKICHHRHIMAAAYNLRWVYGDPIPSYFSKSEQLNFGGSLRYGWIHKSLKLTLLVNLRLSFALAGFQLLYLFFRFLINFFRYLFSYWDSRHAQEWVLVLDNELDYGAWDTLYLGVKVFWLRGVWSKTGIMDNNLGRFSFWPLHHSSSGWVLWVRPSNRWTWLLKWLTVVSLDSPSL